MKKILLLLLAFSLLAGKCKKNDDPADDGGDEQVYECLPEQLNYTDHVDPSDSDQTLYTYEGNAIKEKKLNFTANDGTPGSYTYKYYYIDKAKGLLDRIEVFSSGQLVAKFLYTIQGDLIVKRKLIVVSQSGDTWFDAWEVFYTYDSNGKMIRLQVKDYDLWDEDDDGTPEPTDETAVYTYTGDNVTNIKWYDTADMNTVKEEYDFDYDTGKRTFDNVVTQTYPTTRVNNVTHTVRNIYGSNPTTEETFTTITYNNKGFPTSFEVKDDRNNQLSTLAVTYENCD